MSEQSVDGHSWSCNVCESATAYWVDMWVHGAMGEQFSFGIIADHTTCQHCRRYSVQWMSKSRTWTQIWQMRCKLWTSLVVKIHFKEGCAETDAMLFLSTFYLQWKMMDRLQELAKPEVPTNLKKWDQPKAKLIDGLTTVIEDHRWTTDCDWSWRDHLARWRLQSVDAQVLHRRWISSRYWQQLHHLQRENRAGTLQLSPFHAQIVKEVQRIAYDSFTLGDVAADVNQVHCPTWRRK